MSLPLPHKEIICVIKQQGRWSGWIGEKGRENKTIYTTSIENKQVVEVQNLSFYSVGYIWCLYRDDIDIDDDDEVIIDRFKYFNSKYYFFPK